MMLGRLLHSNDNRITCPVCNVHHDLEEEFPSHQPRASHGAIKVFASTRCPVCLEDAPPSPMVALGCGHLICSNDFERLGGFLTQEAQQRQARQQQEHRRQEQRQERRRQVQEEINFLMMRRLNHAEYRTLRLPEAPSKGAWVLVPRQDHQDLFFLSPNVGVHLEGTFPRDARAIIQPNNKGVLVSAADATGSNDRWKVHDITLNRSAGDYWLPKEAEFVSDRLGGLWSLGKAVRGKRPLAWYHSNNRQGSHKHYLPESAYLIPDTVLTNGVWAYLPERGSRGTTINEQGLWHVSSTGDATHRARIDENAICMSDGEGGVWVMEEEEGGNGTAQLTRLNAYVTTPTLPLQQSFSKHNAIIPCVDSSTSDLPDSTLIFLHCKRSDQWKLCLLDAEVPYVTEICDCPRDAHVVSDGACGVWILQKMVGLNDRVMFSHVDGRDQYRLRHLGVQFPPGTRMVGARM